MATTFKVFYLGTGPEIDPVEGNATAENASALVGNTYGSIGDPLVNHIQTLAPAGAGYSGGVFDGYDDDNFVSNDQFSIDGGAAQTFDGITVYNATITYTDGTTDAITAVLVQDTAGKIYLAPEISANTDQAALEAGPIRSLTIDSVLLDTANFAASRADGNYAVCFTPGTAILTPTGEVLIDDLCVGDLVTTMDNGPQPIRWIGKKHLDQPALSANPNLRPILIRKQLLGAKRDLLVSPQHGMLLGRDHLVRAKHLVSVPKSRVRVACGKQSVTYIHLMFDAHQIIFAEGAPSESYFPGAMAQRMIDPVAFSELRAIFPEVITRKPNPSVIRQSYGDTARTFLAEKSVAVHAKQFAHSMV
ncbi:MAG: Hint domain-containing protein [Pelagimonas sp.]|uniref:Hint domain-containing protein n=1 Tax=Pelagimonas sp. TaxID=2073170 RepID=UPI003D6B47FA